MKIKVKLKLRKRKILSTLCIVFRLIINIIYSFTKNIFWEILCVMTEHKLIRAHNLAWDNSSCVAMESIDKKVFMFLIERKRPRVFSNKSNNFPLCIFIQKLPKHILYLENLIGKFIFNTCLQSSDRFCYAIPETLNTKIS